MGWANTFNSGEQSFVDVSRTNVQFLIFHSNALHRLAMVQQSQFTESQLVYEATTLWGLVRGQRWLVSGLGNSAEQFANPQVIVVNGRLDGGDLV